MVSGGGPRPGYYRYDGAGYGGGQGGGNYPSPTDVGDGVLLLEIFTETLSSTTQRDTNCSSTTTNPGTTTAATIPTTTPGTVVG